MAPTATAIESRMLMLPCFGQKPRSRPYGPSPLVTDTEQSEKCRASGSIPSQKMLAWHRRSCPERAYPRGTQPLLWVLRDVLVRLRRGNEMAALVQSPVLPEATAVGPLSAQLRRLRA